ncbi:MAG: TetR/AcrR family transcriptional regulator [Clostridia bacterium]
MTSKRMDPRVKRTREMLWNALISLLREKEYSKISVQEIAERATLNRTTFYLHFYSKDDLLEQSFEEIMNELKKMVSMTYEEFDYRIDQPHPVLVRLFEQIALHSAFYRTILTEKNMQHLIDRMKDIMTQFMKEGLERMKADKVEFAVSVDITVPYFASAYLGVIFWWLEQDMPYTPTYMARQVTQMSSRGPFVGDPFKGKAIQESTGL